MTWAFPYIYGMILVTGGTGLVGSHLLAKLIETEKNVRAIYRSVEKLNIPKKIFSYYFQENTDFYFSKIEWVQADITDIPALTVAFQEITHVYHCAGFISFDLSEEKKLRKINIEGTANVVNLCISFQVQKLCHVSSIATLGKSISGKKINEESYFEQTKNNSFYSISKFGAEMEVWRGSQEGLDVLIVNPGIIIGPGIWDSGSGLLFQKVWKGLRFHFPKTTGFVAVEDVVKTMMMLME
ncbi:MAG TPA: NAD-dependent epimerase/dehydratase family protein, partial [Flavobacteriaceae bacterium]|nr:NAD-dependent epimerase/dehydratase family protein [Flavobacteriaceae bacterium]